MESLTNQLLEKMPPPGKPMTSRKLAKVTGADLVRVKRSIEVLRKNGMVECVPTGKKKQAPGQIHATGVKGFQLTEAGIKGREAGARITSGPKGPLSGRRIKKHTLREQIWKALRLKTKASIPDILSIIETKKMADPTGNARMYLSYLAKAGIIIKLKAKQQGTAPQSNGYNIYLLLDEKNTGPKAPYYSFKENCVVDPNTGTQHALEQKEAS